MSLHPLPLTVNEATIVGNYQVNLVATFILLAIPYVPAAFATFIVREREVKAKHQQVPTPPYPTPPFLSPLTYPPYPTPPYPTLPLPFSLL